MVLAVSLNGIEEITATVDGVRTFYRRVAGEGPPVVFVHGNPSHSEDWLPFLQRIDRPALALDLPGWGRSERPARFDYSMHGLAAFFERFLDQVGVSEHALVMHDWGALALIGAQQRPERLRRLVLINAVPLLPGYRWHWVARWFWRVPVAGELLNLTGTRRGTALALRQARADRGPMPPEFVDAVWRGYRRGTGRPVLELYRSADPEALAAAGSELARIECPALVVWGEGDPFLPARFGRLYAESLDDAEYVGMSGAGHWPWIERPEIVERVLAFLG
jgi:pimeloyl-ACP methyl ester carboxylesterase